MTVTSFDVTIESVSGLFVNVTLPDNVERWLLGFSAIYFAVVFFFYFLDDLGNATGPEKTAGLTKRELENLNHLIKNLSTIDLIEKIRSNYAPGNRLKDCFSKMQDCFSTIISVRDFANLPGLMVEENRQRCSDVNSKNWKETAIIEEYNTQIDVLRKSNNQAMDYFIGRVTRSRRAAVWRFRLLVIDLILPMMFFILAMLSWMTGIGVQFVSWWIGNP
ncbi:MAG: hypothetical protein AAFN27_01545 [Pseudomonadota bacterium]